MTIPLLNVAAPLCAKMELALHIAVDLLEPIPKVPIPNSNLTQFRILLFGASTKFGQFFVLAVYL